MREHYCLRFAYISPRVLIHSDAKCWAVIDHVVEAITGSVSKRHSHYPERLLSLGFHAYCSIFIITHANQGGSSQWALWLCQHLGVATTSQQPNHFATIWQRLHRQPPHHSTVLVCHSAVSNSQYRITHRLLIEEVYITQSMYELNALTWPDNQENLPGFLGQLIEVVESFCGRWSGYVHATRKLIMQTNGNADYLKGNYFLNHT